MRSSLDPGDPKDENAQVFFTAAYSQAPAAQAALFLNGAMLFSGVFDDLCWGKLPDVLSIVGSTAIILAGAHILSRLTRSPM